MNKSNRRKWSKPLTSEDKTRTCQLFQTQGTTSKSLRANSDQTKGLGPGPGPPVTPNDGPVHDVVNHN